MIEIDINLDAARRAIDAAATALEHREPMMRMVAARLRQAVDENFNAGGRPAWAGLKTPRPHGGDKVLQDTGRLRNSITQQSDNDRAVVGTNVVYAAIHNFGGQTAAHMIYPKTTKALFWAGAAHPVKKVSHPGSRIPARPFMVLTEEDRSALAEAVSDYLSSL